MLDKNASCVTKLKTVIIVLMKNLFLFTLLMTTKSFCAEPVLINVGEFPPFVSMEMKEKGLSSALVTEAFKAVGKKIKIEIYPWPRALNTTQTLDGSASYPWAKNEERQKNFLYSNVLHEDKIRFFGEKETKLQKAKVCYPHDWDLSQFGFALKKYNMEIIARPNSIDQCFLMISTKRLDFTFVNETVGFYKINELGLRKLIIGRDEITADDYTYLIVGKSNPKSKAILSEFNKGLDIIKRNGRYLQIQQAFASGRIPNSVWY